MAINYAEKYSTVVDERFKLRSQTEPAVNHDYDFVGVQTVKVYSIPTVAMGNYTLTGSDRYGTPAELQNNIQELTLSQDRAFTFTIDKRSNTDTMGVMDAAIALSRQIDEVVVPEIDVYRLGIMAANAGTNRTEAITKTNAYSSLLDATVALTNKKCPLDGRIAFVTPGYYKNIKQDNSFIQASDIAQEMLIKGQVGQVDNIAILVVPATYLPDNSEFLVTHRIATVAAQKLAEYKIHEDPPGINGYLVEGRVYYDAFVLNNKKDVIYLHKSV